ncbi:DNA polymerase IV [Cellulomonas bogoriensis]|uniref:DNA polymerase IV n=1 Tax=Cellulomonas bogoriensis 69B4 = DSM 16987 TaxID=1386082 RepID=A0A0A0BTL8_9CELL|nr:DNA polymerase IV [Cellulomonas bogoriensis]KGM11285.1 DNA polymerase IV [Cellulomonas bogoriensis 69B4 = DSM 16987]
MSRRSGSTPRRDWGGDDSGCSILHVDMDAFFASVELVRRPELRGRPVVVGGDGRSVVLAATYEARAFGVHSAMPMARARRLCPRAVVLPPDQQAYREASTAVMALLAEITPQVEQVSVDEAFLDVGAARRSLGAPVVVAQMIRRQVREALGLPCSVGVASTKFVAKLASGMAKPDGLLVVPEAATVPFLHDLPVEDLWGVGERTRAALARWGIRTVAELARTDVAVVRRAVGNATGDHLHALAWGVDPRPVVPGRVEKSVGAEVTLERDSADPAELDRLLVRLSDRCAARLRARGVVAGTVSVKVRTAGFRTTTRSRRLGAPTDLGAEIRAVARSLLGSVDLAGERVRLVGVRAEHLEQADARPMTLEESAGEGNASARRAEQVMDQVRVKFGAGSLGPASVVGRTRAFPTTAEGERDLS